jgi:uncharacterized protein (TIGR03437 family)
VGQIRVANSLVGTASGNAGQTVNLSVELQTQGAQIAGLQFDILCDRSALTLSAAAGTAASAAGKSVTSNLLPGGMRVLIVGLNQTLIGDGSVVNLSISIASGARSGNYPLTITGASGADPSGQSISVSAASGAVVVPGGAPALAVSSTHSGNFMVGELGRTFSVVVSNQPGAADTSGLVTVTEHLPTGLTLVSIVGSGWTCTALSCSRMDALAGGASYPPLTVTVNVANDAPSSVVNLVSVEGGGSAFAVDDDAVALTRSLLRQTIAFESVPDVSFGVSPFPLNATASSGLPVSFVSATLPVCTISGNSLVVIAAGSCTVTANQAGNATFDAAPLVSRTFHILKAAQTIDFAPLNDTAVGASPIALAATASSGLAVSFTSTTPSVCALSGKVLRPIEAGNCSVTAMQPRNSNYLASPAVTRSFTVIRADAPVISPGGVVPVYSTSQTVETGSWITIWGANLAPSTLAWDGNFPIPQSMGGVSVTIDGKPGYLWFVSPGQINLQVPDDDATGNVNVVVTTPAGAFTSKIALGPASPSLSLLDAKHVAALTPGKDGGYDIVGPSGAFPYATHPVPAGAALVLYGVGFGPTDPAVKAGQAVSAAAATVNPVSVTIGGINASVAFSGIVEAGLYQINVTVPVGVPAGDQPVVASVSGIPTEAGPVVTIQ